jgi:(2Fe-2S) ferredoxin
MPGTNDATAYLNDLREETMRLAWGGEASSEDRRRIVSAAIIFGRQFEERVSERPVGAGEDETRRLLMDLMNRVVREFAAHEGLGTDEAAGFLGEVGTRDRVLEFSEVLDAHTESGRPLDDLLREAVEERRERAFRARRGPG